MDASSWPSKEIIIIAVLTRGRGIRLLASVVVISSAQNLCASVTQLANYVIAQTLSA
jgi:hypothetical protein